MQVNDKVYKYKLDMQLVPQRFQSFFNNMKISQYENITISKFAEKCYIHLHVYLLLSIIIGLLLHVLHILMKICDHKFHHGNDRN